MRSIAHQILNHAAELPVKFCCSKRPKKVVHKRISSSGDELQNQVDSGWVNVSCRSGQAHEQFLQYMCFANNSTIHR